PHANQHEEGRQHDELALGEIDGLRGLPQEREADGGERVDASGRKPGNQQLEDVGHHRFGLSRRPLSWRQRPTLSDLSLGYLPIFGRILVIFCLPPTTSARKLMRSTSPVLSQLVSIRMPGSSLGVMVSPCMV